MTSTWTHPSSFAVVLALAAHPYEWVSAAEVRVVLRRFGFSTLTSQQVVASLGRLTRQGWVKALRDDRCQYRLTNSGRDWLRVQLRWR